MTLDNQVNNDNNGVQSTPGGDLISPVITLVSNGESITDGDLDAEAARHQIKWLWVRGHAGHVENERADALARRGVEAVRKSGKPV